MISILLVDDNHAFLETAGDFFAKAGDYEVDKVSSASEALDKLKDYSYDAVLSDYSMSGTSGLDLWKRLHAANDNTPFIIYADEGWEDLVAETLGNDTLRIYLRTDGDLSDLQGLRQVLEETIHKKSEKDALDLAKLNYRQFLSFRSEGIVSVDTDGKIEHCNKRFIDMLGSADEDLKGSAFATYFNEQSAEAVSKYLSTHAENMAEPIEAELLRKDGSRLDVKLSASPKLSDIGQYKGMLFIISDMTAQRKEIAAALAEKEAIEKEKSAISGDLECLREIVDKSSNAVLVLDASGTVAFVNPAAASLFQTDAEQLEGGKPGFPLILDTPVTAGIIGDRRTTIEMQMGGIEWGGQPAYLVTVKDITSHDKVEAELRKVRDELYGKVEGRTAELIETHRTLLSEVTEKKQALTAMNDANGRLKEYRDLLALVCRGIVHANKTGVDNLGKLIEAFGINKEMTRLLSTPLESFNDSSKLAGDAIKYLRSKDMEVKAVDIAEIIRQARAQYPASDKRISILVKPIQPCPVMANELAEEALSSIIENAMGRSAPGRQLMVSIAASRMKGDGGDYCRCIIEDSTTGIADNDKETVFEMPRDISGNGLGLFLVKAIVEGLDGRVWIEDRINGDYTKGCRFVILIPAA